MSPIGSEVKIELIGDQMKVTIRGTGLTPNAVHLQHLHGSLATAKKFRCPTAAADKDDDGQVTAEEAIPAYGDILIALTTEGDVSAKSALAFDRMPVADAAGNLSYERTIPLPEGAADDLADLHIDQHGLDVNGNGKYDAKALGTSTFAASRGVKGVSEEATNLATCGTVGPLLMSV